MTTTSTTDDRPLSGKTPPLTDSVDSSAQNRAEGSGGRGRCANSTGQRTRAGGQQRASGEGFQFKGAIDGFGAVLGTRAERPGSKDQFKVFQGKLVLYAMEKYDYPRDILPIARDGSDPWSKLNKQKPTLAIAVKEEGKSGAAEEMYGIKKMFDEELKAFMNQKKTLDDNIIKMFGVIWGQCSPALQEAIKGTSSSTDKLDDFDAVWLYEQAKLHSSGLDKSTNTFRNMWLATKAFFLTFRYNNESVEDYHARFLSALETTELAGADVLDHAGLWTSMKLLYPGTSDDDNLLASCERMKAMCFLMGANNKRFESLRVSLRNDEALGIDKYPTTITDAYRALSKYEHYATTTREDTPANARVAFQQTGTQLMQFDMCLFHQPTAHIVPASWLLLDSGSTVSSVCSSKLLRDIHPCSPEDRLRVYTNGGHLDYVECGTLHVLPFLVYYNPAGIANILSLSEVAAKFRVTMDTGKERSMLVHVSDDAVICFTECEKGLYYLDLNSSPPPVTPYCFLNTVTANQSMFSRKEVAGADAAQILQQKIGWPSSNLYSRLVQRNYLRNCPINIDDIRCADAIYGPAVPVIKGKTVADFLTKPFQGRQ